MNLYDRPQRFLSQNQLVIIFLCVCFNMDYLALEGRLIFSFHFPRICLKYLNILELKNRWLLKFGFSFYIIVTRCHSYLINEVFVFVDPSIFPRQDFANQISKFSRVRSKVFAEKWWADIIKQKLSSSSLKNPCPIPICVITKWKKLWRKMSNQHEIQLITCIFACI